ncbi:MAG: hypothetical protein A3C43_06105 [Candidatus Schekmanbacteria bacterium RIFCSPHIGHO2_02_FULL_38_11]|nr:MAG: hypothetical protein A3C43_06105 [Candidatus Schekmanbacteria bacterium RIFCSPHIGHO2_02_FULL_38_11]
MHARAFGFILVFLIFLPAISSSELALTSNNANHYAPKWSPSGDFIFYQRPDAYNNLHLYKILSSGGSEIPLGTEPWISYYDPQISPDGTKIVYSRQGNDEIYRRKGGVVFKEHVQFLRGCEKRYSLAHARTSGIRCFLNSLFI